MWFTTVTPSDIMLLQLIEAYATFDFSSSFCSCSFFASYTGVGLSTDDVDLKLFFFRWRPHKYPKVENKTETTMATLIDDAIAIFPSWLKELPVIIIIIIIIQSQNLILVCNSVWFKLYAYMSSRLMLAIPDLSVHSSVSVMGSQLPTSLQITVTFTSLQSSQLPVWNVLWHINVATAPSSVLVQMMVWQFVGREGGTQFAVDNGYAGIIMLFCHYSYLCSSYLCNVQPLLDLDPTLRLHYTDGSVRICQYIPWWMTTKCNASSWYCWTVIA